MAVVVVHVDVLLCGVVTVAAVTVAAVTVAAVAVVAVNCASVRPICLSLTLLVDHYSRAIH